MDPGEPKDRTKELIVAGRILPPKRVEALLKEANELVAIFVTSRKSAASNLKSEI